MLSATCSTGQGLGTRLAGSGLDACWPCRPGQPEPEIRCPHEGITHLIRLYLKKLKELKKLKRYRHVALAGSRVFIRAVQQVNGWENKRYMFASSAVIPAS